MNVSVMWGAYWRSLKARKQALIGFVLDHGALRRCSWLGLAVCAPVLPAVAMDFTLADKENGEEINEVCAGCHGEFGQGGKQGEYPRLAGQPPGFLAMQLFLFRDRKRPNLAMVEYVDERQMPDADIRDISAYLAEIQIPTQVPRMEGKFDAMQFLLLSQRVLNIPRAPGDTEAGERLYNKECRSCHGKQGWGRQDKDVPMIAGQYTNYLWRQVDKYLKRIRIHDPDDPDEELLSEFSREQISDIFAYLSIVDDEIPKPSLTTEDTEEHREDSRER